VQEIASITGHSLKDVSTIPDRHYPGDRSNLAVNGIKKLERKEKRTKTVNHPQTGAACYRFRSAKYLERLVGAQGLEPWTR
jgi:hypothetical protein